jgi:hypothetical protein
MMGENEQKKSLVFNWFKFRGGGGHPPVNSIFACRNKYAYDISGS